jgi:hypothetical protein
MRGRQGYGEGAAAASAGREMPSHTGYISGELSLDYNELHMGCSLLVEQVVLKFWFMCGRSNMRSRDA